MTSFIYKRNDFAKLLNEERYKTAAEIGVAEGGFSFGLLDHWPGTILQIDSWRILDEEGYCVHGDNDQDGRFKTITEKSQRYGGRSILMRMTSAEAAAQVPAGSIDFVYIDANHTYKSAKEDIALWWPKVRYGGVLAGHDYLDGMHGGSMYGVKQAVQEFSSDSHFQVNVTREPDYPSWWIKKI